jgi:L-threonylcarbamoyladenylate synthase
MKVFRLFNKKVIKILKQGGVGVIPTDTIYGVVGSALLPQTVERIYRLKQRTLKKPMIILVSSFAVLKRFGIKTNSRSTALLKEIWPGAVSVVLPCPSKKFLYLHRGTKTLAFRLPFPLKLRKLLANTGPLVAPSANPEGSPPAENIQKAQKYFGEKIDFYVDAGKIAGPPSALIAIKTGKILVLRK